MNLYHLRELRKYCLLHKDEVRKLKPKGETQTSSGTAGFKAFTCGVKKMVMSLRKQMPVFVYMAVHNLIY
jgi:hypothetical protein